MLKTSLDALILCVYYIALCLVCVFPLYIISMVIFFIFHLCKGVSV